MTLPLQTTRTATPLPGRAPVIDRMTTDGRAALLGMMWAAWYSSRSDDARQALAGAGSDDALLVARAAGATTEATLKLLRLRRVTAGDAEIKALVDGLLADGPVLHVPARLREVVGTTESARRRMLARARAEVALLTSEEVGMVAGVLAYLVGTDVDYASATVREAPASRGQTRALLQALGLPAHSYMPRLRSWL